MLESRVNSTLNLFTDTVLVNVTAKGQKCPPSFESLKQNTSILCIFKYSKILEPRVWLKHKCSIKSAFCVIEVVISST